MLGDVINHDVQTLADTIAPPRDIASELRRSEPVTDLHRAIGINDKFLMIRDLFGGDGEAFDAALDALNGFGDLDDCMIYIAENLSLIHISTRLTVVSSNRKDRVKMSSSGSIAVKAF